MDSNSDDRDPEVPPDPSPEELQEALRWLEEMAGRPNAGQEIREATTEFPIQGLLDDAEGDLPDWLRETPPSADSPLTNDGELESRLDWLAKMAERESIEELPTLEWRQLTDAPAPADDEAIGMELDTQPPTVDAEALLVEATPVEATPVEPLSAPVVINVPTPPVEEPETSWELPSEADTVPPTPLPTDETVEEVRDSSPVAPMTAETLLDSLPPDEELPPINDLDAAMAWIEELAASQDAPVEDVPSVADRALTSKLLMEAGLSPDELGLRSPGSDLALGDLSLLEGNTPINAFVAEEDFADTIVLVETMAAEQGQPLVIPPSEPLVPPAEDEVSFDDAMAFLDELAAQEPLGAVTQPVEPIGMDAGEEEAVAEELAAEAEAFESYLSAPDEAVATLTDGEAAAPPEEPLLDDDTPWAKDVPWGADETDEIDAPDMTGEPLPAELVADADALAEQSEWRAGSDDALGDLFEPTVGAAALDVEPAEPPDESAAEQPEPSAGEAPLEAEMAPLPMPLEPAAASLVATNGDHAETLETRLRAVDALALPLGISLAELDRSLHRSGARPAQRDLPAAVEWLELALGISVPTAPPTPSDEDLVARMPDDPDAVLAWLEQLAEEDTVDSSPQLALADAAPPTPGEAFVPLERSGQPAEPQIEELSEDDLLSMPEDPDAVMAWLEGLAGGGLPSQREVVAAPEAIAPPVAPLMPEQPAEPPAAVSRSRRRRGRKSQRSAQPQPTDEAQAEPTFTEDATSASPEVAAEEVAYSFEEETSASPEVAAEEVAYSFEEVIVVVEERNDELPEATVGAAVEEDGLLVWPAADELPDVSPPPATPPETDAAAEAPQVAPPVTARPRRRGRKPKGETDKAVEPPLLIIEIPEEPAGESAADASDVAGTPPPPPEATPPAKPTSWVDLLKPLR